MVQETRLSEDVIHCAFEVSNQLGVGFLESVYENALCIELAKQGVGFQQQKSLQVLYKEQVVGHFVTDLIVENKLLVELKTVSAIAMNHRTQVMNYLKATGIQVGLLLNFGTPKLGVQRIVYQYDESQII
ncbi:MAG: GxxExxY protein [Gammaproteobacteria bacterium]|nr:GxxExxY protein [Gammaproteobacteria bacterium]